MRPTWAAMGKGEGNSTDSFSVEIDPDLIAEALAAVDRRRAPAPAAPEIGRAHV